MIQEDDIDIGSRDFYGFIRVCAVHNLNGILMRGLNNGNNRKQQDLHIIVQWGVRWRFYIDY